MRAFMSRYRTSKYRCFLNGLVFAVLSVVAMFICIHFIMDKSATRFEVVLPFFASVMSMLFGFKYMFSSHEFTR